MTNLVHEVGRVTYTDPTTARLVVADFRAIPLLGERQTDQAPACQLKNKPAELPASVTDGPPDAPRAGGHPRGTRPASRAAVCHIRQLTYREP